MAKSYFDKNGRPSPLPTTVEDAKKHRCKRYIDLDDPCPNCGMSVFYTHNGGCRRCSRDNAADLYSFVTGVMKFEGLATSYPINPHTGYAIGNRQITAEYKEQLYELAELIGQPAPLSRREAVELGSELWVSPDPCGKAGHFGIRTLKGDCYFCEQEKTVLSPRQAALKAGKKRYVPSKPCKICGKIAERDVESSKCHGCYTKKETDARETPDSRLMRENPDLIISRKDARTVGMKVFRTGEPCINNHRGFRYVTTGTCIDCLRGR